MPFTDIILSILPGLIMVGIAFATFGLMYVAKKPIIVVSGLLIKAKSSGGETARNSVAGILGCECISVGILCTTEWLFNYSISFWWGIAAGFLATLIYLFVENIQDASKKKLGEAVDELSDNAISADALKAYIAEAVKNAEEADGVKLDDKVKAVATAVIGAVTTKN